MATTPPPPNPQFEGTGPQDDEPCIPHTSIFEASTFNHFLTAAITGNFPGDAKPGLPLFDKADMHNLSTPYTDWAPEPYWTISSPANGFGPTQYRSLPPIVRIMHVLSGMDNIFRFALSPSTLQPSFLALKRKIWFSMAPVSDARWRANALDAMPNIEEALAIIQQVIDVCEYFRQPMNQGEMRETHNRTLAEIETFQRAIRATYIARGDPEPAYDLPQLWSHFQYLFAQVRAWVFKRLKILYTIWKDQLTSRLASGRDLNATQRTVIIDHWALMVLNKLQAQYADADFIIAWRDNGYLQPGDLGLLVPGGPHIHIPAPADSDAARDLYARNDGQRMAGARMALAFAVAQRTQARQADMPTPAYMEGVSRTVIDAEWAHKALQPQIENPPPLMMESWVQDLAAQTNERFGFVIYRNCYGGSAGEWEAFKTKLEAELESGWEGLVGAEKVKEKATLHWIDGQHENIPENDIPATRKHFNTLLTTPSFPPLLTKTLFLTITPLALSSFTTTPSTTGDFHPFVIAVDPSFSSSSPTTSPPATTRTTAPNGAYPGWHLILAQLVWPDLYGLHVNRGSQPGAASGALAARHPWGVYVGPTSAVRRRAWRKLAAAREGWARALYEVVVGRES